MKEDNNFKAKPYRIIRTLIPENQETPIHFLRQKTIANQFFYNRNHFPYPELEDNAFLVQINGEIEKPLIISYENLKKMPSRTVILPLECSGNKREYFRPNVFGEQWKDGGISQGIWKGVSLSYLLEATRINGNAVEVVFEGHDIGEKPGYEREISFQRSLPIPKALHPDTIIAYEYNGGPIPLKHGYPLRLIVPQWYAMASVKWLKKITVINDIFEGTFQSDDYVYYPYKDSNEGKRPVTTINVSSIIQQPLDYQILDRGIHNIDGIAWTGEGKVIKVEVSFDSGKNWYEATLFDEREHPYSWTFWSIKWDVREKGEYAIMSRAYDSQGRTQPFEAFWNRKGYGYNAVYDIKVKVE